MNKTYLAGAALALVAYLAYKKLKGTQTVTVDSFDTVMPNVLDPSTLAGLSGCAPCLAAMRGGR